MDMPHSACTGFDLGLLSLFVSHQLAIAWCGGTGKLAWVGDIWIHIALGHVWPWSCGREHQQGHVKYLTDRL